MNKANESRLDRTGLPNRITVEMIQPSDQQIERMVHDKAELVRTMKAQNLAYWQRKLTEAKGLAKLAERQVLSLALAQCDGQPTRAARLLGMTHQMFVWRLSKHKGIKRTKVRKRRSSKEVNE